MKRAPKPAVEQQVDDAADGLIAAWGTIDRLRGIPWKLALASGGAGVMLGLIVGAFV